MKYLKLYEEVKDIPYSKIDHREYYNLLHGSIDDRRDTVPFSNRVPFSNSDKETLVNLLEDVVNYHRAEHQGATFISYEFYYPDAPSNSMDRKSTCSPHLRIDFRSELITRASGRLITYSIEKVNDEWFLVTELSKKIRIPLHSRQIGFPGRPDPTESIFDPSNTWKCDQLHGLLEFLKFKNIIR